LRTAIVAAAILAATATASAAKAPEWVHYYSRQDPAMDYFYDPSSVRSSRGRVRVNEKALADEARTTIIFSTEIDCRRATFTEKGTTIFGPDGAAPVRVPKSELLVVQPIQAGLSADRLMKILCPIGRG
jgi:hypothetical protein